MNNYIVCSEQLKNEFNIDNKPRNSDYKDIIEKSNSSDAIIWNAFAPWKYSDYKNNPSLIFKIIEKLFNKKLTDNDFKNNTYSIFGHTPKYFRYTEPDLVIYDKENCFIVEGKFTEDSSKVEEEKCEQIISYLCDIFYKLCLNEVINPYLIILSPKETREYYEYFQIIDSHKNNPEKIKESLKDCLERRKKKNDSHYNKQYDACIKELSSIDGKSKLRKISKNIGILYLDEFKELIFECINKDESKDYCINDWIRYQKFFNDRADIDFLLRCYSIPHSNLNLENPLPQNMT